MIDTQAKQGGKTYDYHNANDLNQSSSDNSPFFCHFLKEHHCCNFQHIVQLQDGTSHSVLCSNLRMSSPHPILMRLRNRNDNVDSVIANDIRANAVTLSNSRHNSSSVTPSPTESVINKMCSGKERIIWYFAVQTLVMCFEDWCIKPILGIKLDLKHFG